MEAFGIDRTSPRSADRHWRYFDGRAEAAWSFLVRNPTQVDGPHGARSGSGKCASHQSRAADGQPRCWEGPGDRSGRGWLLTPTPERVSSDPGRSRMRWRGARRRAAAHPIRAGAPKRSHVVNRKAANRISRPGPGVGIPTHSRKLIGRTARLEFQAKLVDSRPAEEGPSRRAPPGSHGAAMADWTGPHRRQEPASWSAGEQLTTPSRVSGQRRHQHHLQTPPARGRFGRCFWVTQENVNKQFAISLKTRSCRRTI